MSIFAVPMLSLAIVTGALPAAAADIRAGVAPATVVAAPAVVSGTAPVEHKVYGFVQSLNGSTLIIRDRTGRQIVVDGHAAHSSVHFYLNRAVIVMGTTDSAGVIHATAVWRSFPDAAHWPADR